jgi:hypothetical protein
MKGKTGRLFLPLKLGDATQLQANLTDFGAFTLGDHATTLVPSIMAEALWYFAFCPAISNHDKGLPSLE